MREIFLGLPLATTSASMDEYGGMHDDLFETPGGLAIGNNPGASMLGAAPHAVARLLVDRVVAREPQRRLRGATARVQFATAAEGDASFADSRRRGYDVKFGLAVLVMVFAWRRFR
ncbi:MAG: hypothetical protein IPP47_22130 [Bryobacterales bacterium]|nr:hypothetical protein [Bryobacterales bacterium]